MPTPLRTDLCSAMRPPLDGYSTGISQPPKFTIFAPRRRCNALSGVFRRTGFAGEITESIPFARAKVDGSMRPVCRQNEAFLRPVGASPTAYLAALAGGATLRYSFFGGAYGSPSADSLLAMRPA